MTDYLRAALEQFKWDIRAVLLFLLAVLLFCGSAVTLIRGDALWAPLAFLVGSGLFVTLCVYLIRVDVRRTREERHQTSPTTDSL